MSDITFTELEEVMMKGHDRLMKISDKIRKISEDIAAGKTIDPGKIKKLAGSLEYWRTKLLGLEIFCLANPWELSSIKSKWAIEERQKKAA